MQLSEIQAIVLSELSVDATKETLQVIEKKGLFWVAWTVQFPGTTHLETTP
ncbi:hypothetical protein LJR039_005998 [Pseudorhodoferax sp. LjRoot39]|uniref:hypothetical protein n=1 Tax=Pseudorhodoferax sp. LjRoot39 TaxID=3342328 RepID=UPI003ED0FC42